MDFEYELVYLWEWPVVTVLNGPLGLLPLATLRELPRGVKVEAGLASVIQRLVERLQTEATPERAKKLITAAFVLTGLRIDKDIAQKLFQGVKGMRDSTTYQGILEEGRVEGRAEGSLRVLLRLGRKRFGEPDAATLTQLQAITDLDRLDRMAERMMEAASWQELLQTA
jgi:predicted transposase YdaD